MREQESPESLSEHQSLSSGSPPQCGIERLQLGSTPQDLDSASSQSTVGRLEMMQKDVLGQPNPCVSVRNQDLKINQLQLDTSQSLIPVPYAFCDPYYSGLLAAYGPPVQQQMVEMGPGRVPLPIDIAEDGPIYVNSKQYHAIMRRRQIRAKLEAQNKLIKSRKPYLHESRHQHAVKRVRGSGGRFLSTKKTQQSDSSPLDSIHSHQQGKPSVGNNHQVEAAEPGEPSIVRYNSSSNSDSDVSFQHLDHRFPSMTSRLAVSLPGRTTLACNMEQRGTPVVR